MPKALMGWVTRKVDDQLCVSLIFLPLPSFHLPPPHTHTFFFVFKFNFIFNLQDGDA